MPQQPYLPVKIHYRENKLSEDVKSWMNSMTRLPPSVTSLFTGYDATTEVGDTEIIRVMREGMLDGKGNLVSLKGFSNKKLSESIPLRLAYQVAYKDTYRIYIQEDRLNESRKRGDIGISAIGTAKGYTPRETDYYLARHEWNNKVNFTRELLNEGLFKVWYEAAMDRDLVAVSRISMKSQPLWDEYFGLLGAYDNNYRATMVELALKYGGNFNLS